MKKVLIVDISGKVGLYDKALFHALEKENKGGDIISLLIPGNGLLRIVPRQYSHTSHIIKRLFKVIEGLLNYMYLLYYLFLNRVDIIHLQWLPFLEVCNLEYYYFRILKCFFTKIKIILTVHNIYPHNSTGSKKECYRIRFCKIKPLIDFFIVHTENSKVAVMLEFGLEQGRIDVVYHGIFVPDNYRPIIKQQPYNRKWNLIMYGNQSPYKGTDIFIKALRLLPEEVKPKVKAIVCGKTDKSYLNSLQSIKTGVEIIWKPYFVEDSELFSMINESDIIILPYRAISQSGVLLLALYYRRVIITSNLPSFKETLEGFSDDMFSENDNPVSLASVISSYVRGKIDIEKELRIIENLNEKYLWEKSAVNTLKIYQKLYKTSEKCQ